MDEVFVEPRAVRGVGRGARINCSDLVTAPLFNSKFRIDVLGIRDSRHILANVAS